MNIDEHSAVPAVCHQTRKKAAYLITNTNIGTCISDKTSSQIRDPLLCPEARIPEVEVRLTVTGLAVRCVSSIEICSHCQKFLCLLSVWWRLSHGHSVQPRVADCHQGFAVFRTCRQQECPEEQKDGGESAGSVRWGTGLTSLTAGRCLFARTAPNWVFLSLLAEDTGLTELLYDHSQVA